MDPVKKRRATYQDVIDAPERMIAEIIGGELRLSNRPGGPATAAASAMGEELGPPFKRGRGGPGGWLILDEPELHLGDDIVVPDLAGWRRERLAMVPDAAFITVPPDWICEVLSPSTEKTDRAEKMPIYAAAGVQHAWLVHPRWRTLEVFELRENRWIVLAVHKDTDRAPRPSVRRDRARSRRAVGRRCAPDPRLRGAGALRLRRALTSSADAMVGAGGAGYRLKVPRRRNWPRPWRCLPTQRSSWTISSPRDSTCDALAGTLRPSNGE
jgi:hypothetical protein